ncbi:hypothetical protein NY08_2625 [Rhodococcus sp. B7740]|nr:hypothetical protein NY08_2625 [Rhodococcus sp. B7740]
MPGHPGIDAVVGGGHCAGECQKWTRADRDCVGHSSIVGARRRGNSMTGPFTPPKRR